MQERSTLHLRLPRGTESLILEEAALPGTVEPADPRLDDPQARARIARAYRQAGAEAVAAAPAGTRCLRETRSVALGQLTSTVKRLELRVKSKRLATVSSQPVLPKRTR
mgnify:CR=1 FL=1